MRVDTVACLGDTVPVSIGFEPARNIVVQNGVATLGSPERAFLPDGVVCDGMCSYESPVVFTDFAPTATLTSVNDLLYVRLKIEHSYLGDIYMGIKCPNGQRASLINWSGSGHSACTDSVPTSHRGWSSAYSNTSGGTYLGVPVDIENASDKCDSTLESNRAGIGWNYCWSDNTTHGYQYANDDGLLYRSSNRIYVGTNPTVDSSDAAAGTNFYHPDQSFTNLIGCPMNGRWTIEVIDAYNVDNGYIFEWEMALDPSLLPSAEAVTGQEVLGSEVLTYTDSTFGVLAPADADDDTALTYLVNIFTSRGDTIDTTFTVHYYAHRHTYIDDTLCQGDTAWWLGVPYTADTLITVNTQTVHGCDSTIYVHYTFNPSYDLPDTLLYCPRAAFLYEGVDYGGPTQFDAPHLTVDGCDSLVHVVLAYRDSAFGIGMLVSDDGVLWSGDTALHGCRPFEVFLRDTTPLVASRQWHLGDSDTLYADSAFSHLYDTAGLFTLTLSAVSLTGCTDTARMADAIGVHPTPVAAFDWDNHVMVIHDATTPFINLSQPNPVSEAVPCAMDTILYLWEIQRADGGSDTTSAFEPTYTWATASNIADSGLYNVGLTATWLHLLVTKDTLPCIDSVVQAIHIVDDYLKFPSLVTPNGDGNNDTWRIINLLECGVYGINELWIFNQWGEQVYHVKDISCEEDFWDPTQTASPDGTYYYRFAARSKYGSVQRNGIIELLHGE